MYLTEEFSWLLRYFKYTVIMITLNNDTLINGI